MKNIIVFGVERSGTTCLNEIIARYLWEAYGDHYTIYNEFFNRELCKYITRKTSKTYPIMSLKETEERITKTMGNHTLKSPMLTKLHGSDIRQMSTEKEILEFITKTADVVFIERKDIMDQVLSVAIANRTGIWASYKEYRKYTSYKVLHSDFAQIYLSRKMYDVYKTFLPDPIGTIEYNNISKLGEIQILKNLGFNDEDILSNLDFTGMGIKLIEKEQKWKLLENKEEVLEWYDLYFG